MSIHKSVLGHDHVLNIEPTNPNKGVGFSGGVQYLIPGISGPVMINLAQGLGALASVQRTIGIIDPRCGL